MELFAQRLRKSLQINKVSQSELARRINKSQSVVNNYCSGEREPSLEVLVLICKALSESADYLLGIDIEKYKRVSVLLFFCF